MSEAKGPWVGSKVAVLYGGQSEEREVSLKTGASIHNALTSLGYDAFLVDATNIGLGVLAADPPDVVFVAMHGSLGENGGVQGLLECLGIPYTGPGIHACATTMNKSTAKALWRQADLPTPNWMVLDRALVRDMLSRESLTAQVPCVIKPSLSGSSVGISLVHKADEYYGALEKAIACEGPVMVEELIEGRELTVAMMDGQVMGVVEIEAARTFYDYEAKYGGNTGTNYLVPAPLTPRLHEKVTKLAAAANLVVGARGVTRVDIMLDGDDNPYLLELNTMPGMTETSLVPKVAAAAGIAFPRFVEMMLNKASLDSDFLMD